jgi:hypothetical protein
MEAPEFVRYISNHMRLFTSTVVLAAVLGLASSCSNDKGKGTPPPKPVTNDAKDAAPGTDASDAFAGVSGRHRDSTDWTPAEFKSGGAKWRDCGLYVDGKAWGMLWYGEQPRGLKTHWVEQEESLDFKPGHKGPKTSSFMERRYRFAEYLEAMGVNLNKIKEVHLYGGSGYAMVIPKKKFLRYRNTLEYAFGREGVAGKVMFFPPAGLDVNTSFDKIWAIAVYIDKEPPKLGAEGRLYFGDKMVTDMPYFGEPLRGGIRIYKDNKMVVFLKRRLLTDEPEYTTKDPDGTVHFHLFKFLEAKGADTKDIVAGEIIRDELRQERFDRKQLEDITFTASPQRGGKVLLGKDQIVVESLALFTKPIPKGPPTYMDKPPPTKGKPKMK